MIKRIKLPGWIVIILLLSGIVFGVNRSIAQVSQDTSESEEKIVESSAYPGLNIRTMTKESDLYTLSVSQPYTKNKQINRPIEKWLDQQKEDFLTGIKESKRVLEDNDFRGSLNIKVETEEISEKTYTIEFEAYQITGGANGMTKWKSFVIDLNKNKQLQVDDVFQLNDASIKDIQQLILDELHNSDQEISRYVFDDMAAEVLKDPKNWKWSISRDALTIYFDDYEIAAGAAGAIKVEIPMEKIKLHLSEDFANKIDVTIPDKENSKKEKENAEVTPALDPQGKYVALTFDDGPHPEVTPRILDTLKQHEAKATFFMLGIQAEYYPSLADRVEEAGHEIGNHTMNHQDLTTLGVSQILEEAQQPNSIIEKATGETPTVLRPPYGALNEDVKKIASDVGLPIIMWSVDSLDWKSRNAAAVNDVVMSNVAPGSIVLLHDIHSTTADALPQLLTSLKEQGYQMVTVSQLLELWGETGTGPYYGKLK